MKPDPEKENFNEMLILKFFGKNKISEFRNKGFNQQFQEIKTDLWQSLEDKFFETKKEKLEPTFQKFESGNSKSSPIRKNMMRVERNQLSKREEWTQVAMMPYSNEEDLVNRVQSIMMEKHSRNLLDDLVEDLRFFKIRRKRIDHWISLRNLSQNENLDQYFINFNLLIVELDIIPKLNKLLDELHQ